MLNEFLDLRASTPFTAQGDLDGVNRPSPALGAGLYHINTVDGGHTKYEHIGLRPGHLPNAFSSPCSKRTSRRIQLSNPGIPHRQWPSEYINQRVAALLNKLHIG